MFWLQRSRRFDARHELDAGEFYIRPWSTSLRPWQKAGDVIFQLLLHTSLNLIPITALILSAIGLANKVMVCKLCLVIGTIHILAPWPWQWLLFSDAVLVHPLATFHVSFRSATCYCAYMACVILVDAGQLLRLPWATSPVGSGVLLLLCFWWNVVEAPKLPWGLDPGPSFWRDGTISTERLHLGTEHCQTDLTSNWKTIHLRLVLHNLWMVTSCDAKLVGYWRRNCWG